MGVGISNFSWTCTLCNWGICRTGWEKFQLQTQTKNDRPNQNRSDTSQTTETSSLCVLCSENQTTGIRFVCANFGALQNTVQITTSVCWVFVLPARRHCAVRPHLHRAAVRSCSVFYLWSWHFIFCSPKHKAVRSDTSVASPARLVRHWDKPTCGCRKHTLITVISLSQNNHGLVAMSLCRKACE